MDLAKIVLDYLKAIIWPLTVTVILLIFKKEVSKLFLKAKKIDLPGGISVEVFNEEISEAKDLAIEVEEERNPEKRKLIEKINPEITTEANNRMTKLGLIPSPSGLQISYYENLAESNPELALSIMRVDFEMMVKNLAKGFKIHFAEEDSCVKILKKLYEKEAISTNQYQLMKKVLKISNYASWGIDITKRQIDEVLKIGNVLIEDYIAWLDWGFPGDKKAGQAKK